MRSSMYPLSFGLEDSGRVASTALDTIRQVRHETITTTVNELRAGHKFIAQAKIKAGVERQAALAGCGPVRIPSAPGHYEVSPAADAWARNVAAVIMRRTGRMS